jgi:DNA-directed RNA polymerase subunit RPC12/RpoP
MGKLVLIPDDKLTDTDTLRCPNCGFEQKVPRQWGLGSGLIICSRCVRDLLASQRRS